MALTRPNVTVNVVDNSFVIVGSEAPGTHVSGMFSKTSPSLVEVFGTTAEKDNNYMTINTLGEWVYKLNGTTFGGTGQGPTGDWATDWYAAYNFLLYGGVLKIADADSVFLNGDIALDSLFTSTISQTQTTAIEAVMATRNDLIGVIGVTYEGYPSDEYTSGLDTTPTISANNQTMAVLGEKVMLGISNTGQSVYATVALAGDVAGCLVRTDRDSQRWFSPAGTTRGRILNTIRLVKNPNSLEQDELYQDRINSVVGYSGEGIFLWGDITKEADETSTLTRINVVRLINYIKRTLGATARGVMFEVNDTITRGLFTNSANGFLQVIKAGRGLYDYKVICDETNNPAQVLDANQFVADIYIKPTKSINYVKITITNLNTDAQI